ncbi:MAG: hypothetical protein ABS68_11315 [Niastella sp. SCN 39-18]|nr:redoxin domain-containing protein [Sphingobacteriales bacterium]ODT51964.1 MAG: hypothetical protein ABS68_11315 [Niastella sp. SCN 39-18]OJW11493.1 MAG: hypothetical protein BGO53_11165 [Sphingobacteriales bacterium 39-19]
MRYLFICTILFLHYKSNCQTPGNLQRSYFDSCKKVYNKERKESVGKPFKPFSISNTSSVLSSASLSGKVVYLFFGSLAERYCQKEIPYLNQVYSKFRNDSNFIFAFLTTDSLPKINSLKKELNLEFDIYPISLPESFTLNVSHVQPANIILDKSGITRFYECGDWAPDGNRRRFFKNKVTKMITRQLQRG